LALQELPCLSCLQPGRSPSTTTHACSLSSFFTPVKLPTHSHLLQPHQQPISPALAAPTPAGGAPDPFPSQKISCFQSKQVRQSSRMDFWSIHLAFCIIFRSLSALPIVSSKTGWKAVQMPGRKHTVSQTTSLPPKRQSCARYSAAVAMRQLPMSGLIYLFAYLFI